MRKFAGGRNTPPSLVNGGLIKVLPKKKNIPLHWFESLPMHSLPTVPVLSLVLASLARPSCDVIGGGGGGAASAPDGPRVAQRSPLPGEALVGAQMILTSCRLREERAVLRPVGKRKMTVRLH